MCTAGLGHFHNERALAESERDLSLLCTKVMLLDAGYSHAIEDWRR